MNDDFFWASSVGSKVPFCLLVAFLLSPLTHGEGALTDSEIREAIQGAIQERHPTYTAEWWKALGPHTPTLLMKWLETEKAPLARVRLIEGLSWFSDDPPVADYLKSLAHDSTATDLERHSVIRQIALTQSEKELDFIADFLKSESPQTRLTAGRALKKISAPRAQELLSRYLKTEKTPWVVQGLGDLKELKHTPFVASREDGSRSGPNAFYQGNWSGFWIDAGPDGHPRARNIRMTWLPPKGAGSKPDLEVEVRLSAAKGSPSSAREGKVQFAQDSSGQIALGRSALKEWNELEWSKLSESKGASPRLWVELKFKNVPAVAVLKKD